LDAEGKLAMTIVAAWNPQDDTFHVLEFPEQADMVAAWAGLAPADFMAELDIREGLLQRLLEEGAVDGSKVSAAVAAFYKQRGIS
jgi:hypothetical protein